MAGTALKAKDTVALNDPSELREISEPGNDRALKILPKSIAAGSTVFITAPASPVSSGEVGGAVKLLKSWGCNVRLGNTITKPDKTLRYLSAPDDMRAEEFMTAVNDPSVDFIFCGRGGYGVMRILDRLDFEAIRNNPKIVMGFSDITVLVNAIYSLSGVVSFHGPVASSSFDTFTVNALRSVIHKDTQFSPFVIKAEKPYNISEGIAYGRLIGGNLRMLVSTLGTPYEIRTADSILFIEEVSEPAYQIDRMLTQLHLAGKLKDLKGIVIGNIENLNKRSNFFPGLSLTTREVLEQLLKPLGIPTVIGYPFGHVRSKVTLPIGTLAELDTISNTFTLIEPSVLA